MYLDIWVMPVLLIDDINTSCFYLRFYLFYIFYIGFSWRVIYDFDEIVLVLRMFVFFWLFVCCIFRFLCIRVVFLSRLLHFSLPYDFIRQHTERYINKQLGSAFRIYSWAIIKF